MTEKDYTGITRKPNKINGGYRYVVQLGVNGARHYIGTFATFDEAYSARQKAKKQLPPEKNAKRPLKIDLTGKRFGHLTVIKPLDERGRNQTILWLCQCDCGNQAKFSTGDLNYGSAITCGDKTKHILRKDSDDLTGRTFGHLTVLKLMPFNGKDRENSEWLCQCDCGKKTTALYHQLISGRKTSCGHLKNDPKTSEPARNAYEEKWYVDGLAVGTIDSSRKKVAKNSKTGITGVSIVQRKTGIKYLAQIYIDHVRTRLGYFDTIEEAKDARLEAEKKILDAHPKKNK